ncbi:MAG: HAD family hydrolase [Myxococcota bacterium]
MRPIVFDLDQTLIRAEALDWSLWLAAITEALGVPIPADEDWSAHPVHTDHGLLQSLSHSLRGRPFTGDERAHFEDRLFARLDDALAGAPEVFVAIPGAADVLDALAGRAALATGNLHAITTRKLRSSGLDRHAMPCSCSAAGIDRTELVGRALARVGWTGGPATSFGDGVWDVRAARALGVGFVGVAQTDAHEARLHAAGARRVLRDYTDLARVLDWIEEAEVPGPEASAGPWVAPRDA